MTHIVVIGSGSGGLTAAIGLAKVGYKVTVIEKAIIGGDCTNYGCVPSKALLFGSHKLHDAYKEFQGTSASKEIDKIYSKKAEEVLQGTRNVVGEFQEEETPQWLESFGIEVILGEAKFLSENSIIVSQQIIKFDKCVIATGSKTLIPEIEGLKDTPYLTNHSIFDLKKVPQTMTVIGNGPIGVELGEAFNCLGCKVTLIGNTTRILPRSDTQSSQKLQNKLEDEGMDIKMARTTKVSHSNNKFHITFTDKDPVVTEQLLIATGRRPNIDLDLEKAGVKYNPKGVEVNKFCQTSNKNIYAIGDVVSGVPNFTHFAGHMGKAVVTNLAIQKYSRLPLHFSKYSTKLVPGVTFTSLELAEAGLSEEAAAAKYGKNSIKSFVYDFKSVDRAKTHKGEPGHIKVITKGFFGRIIGVSIVSTRAGEMLPEFQYLIAKKKTMFALNTLIRAYPSYTSSLDNLFKEWDFSKFSKS